MGVFKETRDMLKANGFVSHLEYAVHHFRPRDMWQCEHHLRGAEGALAKVKKAHVEYVLAAAGWHHVAQLAAQLHAQLLQHGFAELAKIAREIAHYACIVMGEREDPVSDSELAILGPVDEDGFLIEPPTALRVMRDPFPFPSSKVQPQAPLATNVERPDIIPAWQTAARELGIRITTNKAVTHPDKVTLMFPIHLPDFGRPGGILLWTGSIHDQNRNDDFSASNPPMERTADRCVEQLSDSSPPCSRSTRGGASLHLAQRRVRSLLDPR